MFMPIYDFTFSASAVGLPVTVKDDSDGTVVNTGTLSSMVYTLTLDEGQYTARAFDAASGLEYQAEGVIDVAESIANAPGAAETAYFVATYVGATDNASEQVTLTVQSGTEVRDWAPIVDGAVALTDEAGRCETQALVQTDLDYSGTTAPDAPGDSFAYYSLQQNGDDLDAPLLTTGTSATGEGSDLVSLPNVGPDGATVSGGTIAVLVAAGAHGTGGEGDPIVDGVATHHVALTITRIAPSPVAWW